MNGQRGDDLDDDFVPDELVATSGEEDEVGNRPDDDVDGLLSADEEAEGARLDKEKSTMEKKRRRREKEKERKAKVRITLGFWCALLTSIIPFRGGSWQKQPRLSNLFQWQRNLLTNS